MEVRKASPVVMIAQTIRASLLANATATTLGGLRSERGQPVAQRALALWRRPQDRDGAQHQKPSDIPIALLGYRPEFLLAASRVLLGRHAKPGGEIAAGFEGLRIWRAGQNRRSGERADAGDDRRQPADWIASMVGDDRALRLVDRRVERPQLCKQNPQRRLDHRRKVGGGGSLDEFLDVADPFGGDDTELRQMTPQGVHAHRALLDQQFTGLSVACWSSLLTATKRMFGRDIASQIAAASALHADRARLDLGEEFDDS